MGLFNKILISRERLLFYIFKTISDFLDILGSLIMGLFNKKIRSLLPHMIYIFETISDILDTNISFLDPLFQSPTPRETPGWMPGVVHYREF